MFTLRTKLSVSAAAIAAAAGSLLSAAPASAAPPSYTHVAANVSFPSFNTPAGGYVDCPRGMLAIASGAVSSDLHATLMTSVTTPAHTGAFASAVGEVAGETLQVKAQCVAASRLSGTTTTATTVRDSRAGGREYTRKATCPTGTVAYGGGGTVYSGSVYDVQGLYTFASKPDGASWTYAGWGDISAPGKSLSVEAHCLPRARLGKIVTVTETVTSPTTFGLPRVFVGARCPAGFTAFAGGAWWHTQESTTPARIGRLRVSEMSADDRGWFAGGDAFGYSQLTAKVRCTDRLG